MDASVSRGITRVRFKTACTECQRRRKKCNREKPCRNCARRYPPVDCIYETHKSGIPIGPSGNAPHNQRVSVSATEKRHRGSFQTPSSLCLPNLVHRSSSNIGAEGNATYQPLVVNRQRSFTKITENQEDIAPQEVSNVLTRLHPGSRITYGISQFLSERSIEPTASHAQLFDIYFKGVLPALWSADGASPPPPIIREHWIPFITSSPIILHSNLLRAAIWRITNQPTASEITEHHLPDQTQFYGGEESLEILTLKSKSISLLNERLRSPGGRSVDDEAIASVISFCYNEWCWGIRESCDTLRTHAKGLREMLRIRGGIKNILTEEDFLGRFIMLMNYHLAIILERELYLCPPSEHNYQFIPEYKSPKGSLNSPLYMANELLNSMASTWSLDNTTAQILEDMSFITSNIHSYMSVSAVGPDLYTSILDVAPKQWFLELNQIENRLLLLPPLSFNGSSTLESFIYECCRLTAIVYCKAVTGFIQFSVACTLEDLDRISSTMDLVPVTKWTQIIGVWLWILCVVNPSARHRLQGLRLRMFLKNCTSAIALTDWQILVNCMESFLSVQLWIRERGRKPLPTLKAK